MRHSEIKDGYHHRCGGKIKVYEQNFPTKLLVGCLKCGDYLNTDSLIRIEMCATKTDNFKYNKLL